MKEEDLKIWNLVHDWCNGLKADIPDMAKRYLMDKIESYVEEVTNERVLKWHKVIGDFIKVINKQIKKDKS